MTIRLNGDPYELDDSISIATLLERLGINPQLVAVEYNQSVVKRARYGDTIIEEGSEVEIVNFVGGGGPGRGVRHIVQS
jgi:sulfur carrier protein